MMKRMFALILALAMLAVSAAMAEGDISVQSETTQPGVQESMQQAKGPGGRMGPGRGDRQGTPGPSQTQPGAPDTQPNVNEPPAAEGTAGEQPDAMSQATAAKGPQGSSPDGQNETNGQSPAEGKTSRMKEKREKPQTGENTDGQTENREVPSGGKQKGTRPGSRSRTAKADKQETQGTVKAPETAAEQPGDLPETKVPAVIDFEAMAAKGVISVETLEEIRAYLEENSLEAAEVENLLEKLLEDSVITKTEYDALSAAR